MQRKKLEDMLKDQISYKSINSFLNVYIALMMYLAILGMNCEGECSFSKLKLIKNCLQSTMGQQRLFSLALLCIENETVQKTSFEDVIADFAMKKSRKVHLRC
jgi:hypothetical protein